MKAFFCFFCAILIFTNSASAQIRNRTISGIVSNEKTGLPIPGANIYVEEARTGVAADSAGRYLLRNIAPGHYLIEVSHIGYSPKAIHIDVNSNTELDVSLSPSIIENQGVTVTGVTNATSIRKSPISVTSMRREELLRTAATNIVDALAKQVGVAQVSTGPAISKPVIRGLGFNRVVVINDGIRQEGQQWGEEHGLELDDASVQRAEILKGPASLIYGSDALAGVVNLITNVPVAEGTIKGNILGNYQSNNHLQSYHANIAGNQNGFSWNAYGTSKTAGDYKNRYDGRVLNSRFNERNFGGYVGLNKGWGYSHLIFSRFEQKVGIVEGDRDDATGKFLLYIESPLERIATEDDLNGRKPLVPYQGIRHYKIAWNNSINFGHHRIKLDGGFQNNQRKEFGNPEDPDETELFFDLKTATYNLHWNLPDMKHWRTTIGVNGMYQKNNNKGEERIIPDYHFNDIGAFVYAQGIFKDYTLSGGVRFDNRFMRAREFSENGDTKFTAFSRNFSNVSGSAGISYEPDGNVILKANIASGFRAPNLAELASNGAHEGTNRFEHGSQNLKSEKSLQADLGAVLDFEHISISLSGFYNRVNDFIYYRKLEGVNGGDSLVNVDGEDLMAFQFSQNNAQLSGLELDVDLHPHPLDWLHFQNKISYVRGSFRQLVDGTDNLPLIPAPRWNSELRGNFEKVGKNLSNAYVRFEADHNFRQNKPFYGYNTETVTHSYTLLNAGIGADIQSKNRTIFSLHFTALNIADQSYQNHLSRLKYTDMNNVTGRQGVFNLGRNFSIKINVPITFNQKK